MDLNKKIKESFQELNTKAPKNLWANLSEQLDKEKSSDNLDAKIKESFQELNTENQAPKNLWAALSNKLDKPDSPNTNIDAKIKESFEQQKIKAPQHIWDNINKQLNINTVWSKINKQLDQQPIVSNWIGRTLRFSAVAALLLLFSKSCINTDLRNPHKIFSFHNISNKPSSINNSSTKPLLSQDNLQNHITTNNSNSNSNSNKIAPSPSNTKLKETTVSLNTQNIKPAISQQKLIPQASKTIIKTKETIVNSHQTINVAKSQSNIPIIASKTNNKTVEDNSFSINNKTESKEQNLASLAAKEISSITTQQNSFTKNTNSIATLSVKSLTNPNNLATQPKQEEVEQVASTKKLDNHVNKKWEVGLVYNLSSTVFINPETFKSLDKNSLSSTKLAPANSYGFTLSYRLDTKQSLNIECFLNSEANQTYGVYIEGRYYDRKVELNYTKLALNHKYYVLTTKGNMPSKTYIQTGAYASFLTNKLDQYHRNNVLEFQNHQDGHKNWDVGLRLGFGQDMKFGRILIGLGIQAEFGLSNAFEGNQYIPSSFNRTNIFNIGGALSLRYLL